MAESDGIIFGEKATQQIAKTVREVSRRMMNEQPHRARWQFHGGGTGLTHGIVTADLGCGRYTIEKAEWSGDDATDGIGLGSGSGIGDCDICYDVTGEGTSACAITLTTPPLQVTGLGVYVRGHDYASTLIPLVVGTGCLIANLGDQDLDGTAIWQIVRGFQHHVVEYKERWDCCLPDGPETLLGRTPVILIGKECDEISCGACPGLRIGKRLMGATIFGRIHNKNCCCTEGCPGCCMPVDGNGDPVDIPFEIDAPGCSIDGLTGVFNPLAIAGVSGACGVCGQWGYSSVIDLPGSFWNPDGMGGCDLVPGCVISWCMFLYCTEEFGEQDDQANDTCCRRMRLYVASTYDFAGATNNGGTGQCTGKDFETYLAPSSCTCTDGVLSATFPLGILNPLAQVDPACGTVQPCVPECSMSGITLVI